AALTGGAAWLALGFLVLFVQQRRRLAKHRLRSRRELETLLKQHAQELRTAQDGLLQAATDADSGLSRSLEHLPQGVVVIDRELRLVAWNSRYLELFRFPQDLVRVGRRSRNCSASTHAVACSVRARSMKQSSVA
ncbi:hypothetical protein SM139_4013, partial [Stenotrophomonas maltophilia]